jgi:hypothetical protein
VSWHSERHCKALGDDHRRDFDTLPAMKYLAIIGAIVAAIVLSQLLFDFYQWNQQQSCASSGRRNCGGGPLPVNR